MVFREIPNTLVRTATMRRATLVTCLLALISVSVVVAEGEFVRAEFRSCSG